MKELTDDDVTKIEQLLNIKLLDSQKNILKAFWKIKMNSPEPIIDCNNCAWLNLTETE